MEQIFFITLQDKYSLLQCLCQLKGSRLLIKIKTTPFLFERTNIQHTDQAMELQAMLPGGQQINDASQQASESTVVSIEQVDEDNSCFSR